MLFTHENSHTRSFCAHDCFVLQSNAVNHYQNNMICIVHAGLLMWEYCEHMNLPLEMEGAHMLLQIIPDTQHTSGMIGSKFFIPHSFKCVIFDRKRSGFVNYFPSQSTSFKSY